MEGRTGPRPCTGERLLALLRRLVGKARFPRLALLGLGELGRILALDQLDIAASSLDRLTRALADAGHAEAELGRELAFAQDANAVLAATTNTSRLQHVMVDGGIGVELARVDQLLDRTEVHL